MVNKKFYGAYYNFLELLRKTLFLLLKNFEKEFRIKY